MAVLKNQIRREHTKIPAYFHLDDPAVWQPILNCERAFLFLDFDGTVVDIAATPSEVTLTPKRRRYLEALTATPGILVALVSGRGVDEIRHLAALENVFYVGLHGLTILTPQGLRVCYPAGQGVVETLQSLREKFDRAVAEIPGLFLESKGSLALHFRLAEKKKASPVLARFVQMASAFRSHGIPIQILRGKGVIEVKPSGMDKGKAVGYLLDQYGKGALPIYIGDDVTDESAFQMLEGRGISILVTETPRPTAALHYLRNPNEVHQFLKQLIHGTRKKMPNVEG